MHELWFLAAKVQLLAAWSGEGLSIATEGDTIISPILCTRQVRWSEINVMLPEASRGDCKRRFSISMPSKSVSCQFYQPEWSRMKSFYSSDLSQTRTSNHGYFCAFVCALMFSVCMCSQVCMYCFIHQTKRPNRRPKGMCWHYPSSHWPGWWYGKSKLVVLIVLWFFKYALTTYLRTYNSPIYWIRPSTAGALCCGDWRGSHGPWKGTQWNRDSAARK